MQGTKVPSISYGAHLTMLFHICACLVSWCCFGRGNFDKNYRKRKGEEGRRYHEYIPKVDPFVAQPVPSQPATLVMARARLSAVCWDDVFRGDGASCLGGREAFHNANKQCVSCSGRASPGGVISRNLCYIVLGCLLASWRGSAADM